MIITIISQSLIYKPKEWKKYIYNDQNNINSNDSKHLKKQSWFHAFKYLGYGWYSILF